MRIHTDDGGRRSIEIEHIDEYIDRKGPDQPLRERGTIEITAQEEEEKKESEHLVPEETAMERWNNVKKVEIVRSNCK